LRAAVEQRFARWVSNANPRHAGGPAHHVDRQPDPFRALPGQPFLHLFGNRVGLVDQPVFGPLLDPVALDAHQQGSKQSDGQGLEQSEAKKHLPSNRTGPPAHELTSGSGKKGLSPEYKTARYQKLRRGERSRNLLAVKTAVLDEDFVGPRTGNDDP